MKRYALTMRRYERQTAEVRIESTNEKSLKIQYFVDCSDYYKQLMVCTSVGKINGYKQPGDEITRTPINCIHSLAIALQRFICLTINYLDPQLNEWIESMYVCVCARAIKWKQWLIIITSFHRLFILSTFSFEKKVNQFFILHINQKKISSLVKFDLFTFWIYDYFVWK